MTARGFRLVVAGLALVAASATAARAEDDALEATLRGVVETHLAAYDREDVAATLATIDSRSPAHAETQEELDGQFPAFDLKPSLVSFDYIGHDDEFAVGRAKTQIVSETRADFSPNTVDAILIFHQEGGVWKLWAEHVLGVELLD